MDDESEDFTRRVVANVRVQMARRRITQARLAELADMSIGTMSRRLNCEYGFTTEELGRVADALGVKIEVLVKAPASAS